MSEPFATVEQLQAFWRPLNASEQARAGELLGLASDRLRVLANRQGRNLDIEVGQPDNGAFANVVGWVVMEATKRAMLTPVNQMPVDSMSQTAGPYSENYKFTNPSADLWFKKSELSDLGLAGAQKLNNIKTTSEDIYD